MGLMMAGIKITIALRHDALDRAAWPGFAGPERALDRPAGGAEKRAWEARPGRGRAQARRPSTRRRCPAVSHRNTDGKPRRDARRLLRSAPASSDAPRSSRNERQRQGAPAGAAGHADTPSPDLASRLRSRLVHSGTLGAILGGEAKRGSRPLPAIPTGRKHATKHWPRRLSPSSS